jgi:hypothetical protein
MLLLWFSDEEACQKPIVKSLDTESKKLALLFEVNASPRLERARISLYGNVRRNIRLPAILRTPQKNDQLQGLGSVEEKLV